MFLLEILESSTDYLKERGVESPRLQAELLLSHVLGMPRLELYMQFDREVGEGELSQLRPLLKRRGEREPLQHIVEEVFFCETKLKCSPDALVPRPETELLVQKVVERLREQPPGLVYDVGTGSGAIAIAFAGKLPGWRVIATDVSEEALSLARENHVLYPKLNISWKQQSLLDGQTEEAAAVVANLPYLTREEMVALPPEVQKDPPLALDGGKNGLDWTRKLIPQAAELSPLLFLEVGEAQAEVVAELCREAGYAFTSIENDLAERQRFVIGSKLN